MAQPGRKREQAITFSDTMPPIVTTWTPASGVWSTITSTGTAYEDYSRADCSFRVEFEDCSPNLQFMDLIEEQKEEGGFNVLEKLLDLVFVLNLSQSEIEEIKKICEMDDYLELVVIYLVAKAVKEGLTAETLGYKED